MIRILNSAIQSVNAAALLLGAAGLLSRVLGIFRDRLLAGTFGAGKELDIYYAAFQIPDLLSVLFVLGAGTAAILPVFQQHLARGSKEARELISELTSLFVAGSIIMIAVVFLAAPFMMRLVVPGFSLEDQAVTVLLTRIMLLSPLFFGLSSIFSSVVQSFHRFFAYALAPILYNIGIICGIVFFVPVFGLAGLAMGVVLGACAHFGIQYITIARLGFAPSWGVYSSVFSKGVSDVVRMSLPRVLAVSLSQLTLLALIALGSTLMAGSISVFQLAQNLYFLPIGIFGVSYATVVFPRLSRAFVRKEGHEFFQELFLGIRSILFWVVPSAILMIVLRAHIVRVAFGAGVFSWNDTRFTAAVLAILACAIGAGALLPLLIKSFYALEDTWRPLMINATSASISIVLALLGMHFFGNGSSVQLFATHLLRIEDLPHPGVLGLAFGFAGGTIADATMLYIALRRLAKRKLGVADSFPPFFIIKVIVAGVVAGIVCYGVRASFSYSLPLISFIQVLWQGGIAGVAGFITYFGILYALRNEEVVSFIETLRKRAIGIRFLPKLWDEEGAR